MAAIAVAGFVASGGVAHAQTPTNDAFAGAQDLGQVANVGVRGDNSGATREANEPYSYWGYGDSSVWYSWRAPSTGALTVDTAGSGFNTVLDVYTGTTLSAGLTRVASSGDAPGLVTSRARLRVTAGTTYWIQVDGNSPSDGGAFNLNLALVPPPANDAFALATDLPSAASASASGSNVGAGIEVGEPNPFSYDPAQSSVWYSWQAPKSGSMTIRATGDFQSVITAYTGSSLTQLERVPTQAQQAFNGGSEQVRIRVEAGVTYRIAITGRYGASGDFALSLSLLDLPANDDFANPISLASQLSLSVAGNNINATQQVGEPIHDDNYCDPSVWYTWTAPISGGLTLDTSGSAIRTLVGVYTGTTLESLTRVPTTRVAASGNGDLRFVGVQAGVTYRIAVDGACGAMGNFQLAFSLKPPPANDLFALAEPLEGAVDTATGSLIGATGEAGEPNPSGEAGASTWYSWQAPSTGVATVKASSSHFTPELSVYTGGALTALQPVPRGYGGSFAVEAGTTYRIAVHGGSRPSRGDFSLSLNHATPPPNDAFGNAEVLEGASDTADGDLSAATGETGEPNPGGASAASVWYSWRAPSTGVTKVRATSSRISAQVAVYTGDAVSGLKPIPSNNNAVAVEAGTTYRIAVHGGHWPERGSFSLALRHATPPANDAFADAELLEGASDVATGDLTAATAEAGEPNPGGSAGTSVWYSWRAPSTGMVAVRSTSSEIYPQVQAFTGESLGSLTRLEMGYDGFRAQEGMLYRILVRGGSAGDRGTFSLSLVQVPLPANDDFAKALSLSGETAEASGSTAGATRDAGDDSDQSVWYSWTAPRSGPVTIDVTGEGGHYTTLNVYQGSSIGERTSVADDHHGAGNGASRVTFEATAGTTYRIAVGTCYAAGGFRLRLDQAAASSDPPPQSNPPPVEAGDRPTTSAWRPTWPQPSWQAQSPGRLAQLDLQTQFKGQRLADVLRRGLRGAAACSRDCSVLVTVAVAKPVSAARSPHARATLVARAGPGKGFVVRLPKAMSRQLARARSARLRVRLVARSGGEMRTVIRQVSLRR